MPWIQDRLVEVLADRGSNAVPRWVIGSGFLIDGRRVLTSGHVAAEGALLVRRVGGFGAQKTEWNARLTLLGDLATADLALIQLDQEVGALPLVGFSQVSRRTAYLTTVEDCHAVGFPRFIKGSDDPSAVRETAHVRGHIPIAQNLVTRLLTLQVTATPRAFPPSRELLNESQWSGMSGAAVLVEGRVLGVISEHAARQGDSSLTVVPLSMISELPNAASWWAELGVGLDDLLVLPKAPSTLARWLRSVADWRRSLSKKRQALVLASAAGAVVLAALALPLITKEENFTPDQALSANNRLEVAVDLVQGATGELIVPREPKNAGAARLLLLPRSMHPRSVSGFLHEAYESGAIPVGGAAISMTLSTTSREVLNVTEVSLQDLEVVPDYAGSAIVLNELPSLSPGTGFGLDLDRGSTASLQAVGSDGKALEDDVSKPLAKVKRDDTSSLWLFFWAKNASYRFKIRIHYEIGSVKFADTVVSNRFGQEASFAVATPICRFDKVAIQNSDTLHEEPADAYERKCLQSRRGVTQ